MSARTAPEARGARPADRLRLRTDPVRLVFSASPWRAAGYLTSYLVLSWVTFSVALTAVTTAVALAVTLLALPLMIAVAWVVHWCAGVERVLLRQIFAEPVTGQLCTPGAGRDLGQREGGLAGPGHLA